MKALLLREKGQWKNMKVEEVETPNPGPGELLVEVYEGLNPVDYKTATGGNPNWSYPHFINGNFHHYFECDMRSFHTYHLKGLMLMSIICTL